MEILPKACSQLTNEWTHCSVVWYLVSWVSQNTTYMSIQGGTCFPHLNTSGMLTKAIHFRKNDLASWFAGISGCSVLCADINRALRAKENRWVSCFSSLYLVWLDDDSLGRAQGLLVMHGVIIAICYGVMCVWCTRSLSQGLPRQSTLYARTVCYIARFHKSPSKLGADLLNIT